LLWQWEPRGSYLLIPDALQADAIIAELPGGGAAPRLLVFGVGEDSRLWQRANCNGHTTFLEEHSGWLHKVKSSIRDLDAHLVNYGTTCAGVASYMAYPFDMEVPEQVASECYDVILVDAPTGFDASRPCRMQAAHFAMQRASECLESGTKQRVAVFLHDAERPTEQEITQKLVLGHNALSGHIKVAVDPMADVPGHAGLLKGWRITKPGTPL